MTRSITSPFAFATPLAARPLAAMLLLASLTTTSAQAQTFFDPPAPNMPYQAARHWYGYRVYYGYPYLSSYGPRHDPYWSYNSSYFPYQYHNDGSYYGLGYSGYAGDGWYGSYYYW